MTRAARLYVGRVTSHGVRRAKGNGGTPGQGTRPTTRLESVAEFLFITIILSDLISDRRASQFLPVNFRQVFFFAASLGG